MPWKMGKEIIGTLMDLDASLSAGSYAKI